MAAPAKLEINSWIETVRKHIEQVDQVSWGEFKSATVSTATQAALESLKSFHDDLLARTSMLEFARSTEQPAAPASPFSGALDQGFANQIAGQIANQVVSPLAAQISQQLSDHLSTHLSTLFASSGMHPRVISSGFDGGEASGSGAATHCAEPAPELPRKLTESKSSVWSLDRNHETHRASDEVAELQSEIASLQTLLAAMRTDCWKVANSNSGEEVDKLTTELADLRQQNADLAMQLARAQTSSLHNPPHMSLTALNQESMTWEQRKQLILQQLENESTPDSQQEFPQLRIRIEEVLRTTQAEIERRNEEIAELKSIVVQQSNTREGVAIGAAAIAQMLDSDELVKLEREKLVAIQQEWESKLREAEIQMSIERAKLSRERAELELQIRAAADLAVSLPMQTSTLTDADNKPVRRWLEHLGLRDK